MLDAGGWGRHQTRALMRRAPSSRHSDSRVAGTAQRDSQDPPSGPDSDVHADIRAHTPHIVSSASLLKLTAVTHTHSHSIQSSAAPAPISLSSVVSDPSARASRRWSATTQVHRTPIAPAPCRALPTSYPPSHPPRKREFHIKRSNPGSETPQARAHHASRDRGGESR
jgi:hypothetical protein